MFAGITPAYAGNTNIRIAHMFQSWDHPRLRGEHFPCKSAKSNRIGSPPPTRGTLSFYYLTFYFFGITPAYAGNT